MRIADPETVRVVPGPTTRLPWFVLGVAVSFLALAILKPWPTIAPAPLASGRPVSVPSATAEGVARPVDPNAISCMSSSGERVLSIIRWPGHEVRTWQATDGAVGSAPVDPGVAALAITSGHVIGIGLCARRPDPSDPTSSAAEIVEVERLSGSATVPEPVSLGAPPQLTRILGGPDAGVLFGPPTRSLPPTPRPSRTAGSGTSGVPSASGQLATTPLWPVGVYVLGYRYASDPPETAAYWLRIRIEAVAGEPP